MSRVFGRGFVGAAGVLVLASWLPGSAAWAAEQPKSIMWKETAGFRHVDGTGPYRASQERLRHERNLRRLAANPQALSSPQAASEDVGDIAVIVDNGSIIIPPRPANPFDLPVPVNIEFSPTADGFSVAFAAASLDGSVGPALALGDDDSTEVPLPFSFPFLGNSYTSVFVNSDGNITLGAGDSASSARDAGRLIGGPPRIAAFFADLDVTSGGSINADVRADRIVVTWTAVPEFGTTLANTFQMVLFGSGDVTFAYGPIASTLAVVGVAEGNDEGPINELDLTSNLPGSFAAGAIFEEFAAAIVVQQMDVIALAREFYRTHPDKYDFLVMFTDPVVDIGGGAFAFHLGLKNQTTGIGRGVFDSAAVAGSAGELESILNMNRIGLYWPDANKLEDPPIKKFRFSGSVPGATLDGPPGANQISRRARWMGTLNDDFGGFGSYTLGLNSAMSIMGQEAGHRWLSFVPFVHPTKGIGFDSFDLLGRSFAHWSFFFNVTVPPAQFGGDARASSAEGNSVLDLGPFSGCERPGERVFLTEPNELIDGFTELDQYLMGLRTAADVPGFWYVDEPNSISTGGSLEGVRGFAAQDDIAFCGKRVDLTVANIQAFPGVGPRTPAIGDEVDQDAAGNARPDVKTMAFILLVEQGAPRSPAHASAISQVDNFRTVWQAYANGAATGGRARFDTVLDPAVH